MNRDNAERIAQDLHSHPYLGGISPRGIVSFLQDAPISDSLRFSQKIEGEDFPISPEHTTPEVSMLSFSRLLRNNRARQRGAKIFERFYQGLIKKVGIVSSDLVVGVLLTNERLVREIASCPYEFSTLGWLTTYVPATTFGEKVEKKRPILIVPGVHSPRDLRRFESDNTVYKANIGLIGLPRIISEKEYLSY